jgi:RHS repeat-associated protein
MRRGGNSYFYLRDGLGSITSLSNNSESVVNTYEYDAFGNVVNKTGSVTNPYGYTGRILDSESGLMYYRARYYDQKIGRFITADPIGLMGGINFYVYVGNNPINLVDPTGLINCLLVDLSIGGAYYAGAAVGCTLYLCKTCEGWKSIKVCYLCLCAGMDGGVGISFGACVAKSIESLPGFGLLVEGSAGYFSGQFTTNFSSSGCLAGGVGLGAGGYVCGCHGWSV